MTFVYKNYDQATLNKQYNNRSQVSDFEQVVQQWERESEALRQRTQSHLDLAYGPHERNYLDIFFAAKPDAPVLVFFHGGYWQAMNKRVFHFIAGGVVEQGITTVLVNYPLGPQATMDEIISACRRAMAWLYRHIAEYGGDPQRIHISGHSAGGHLVGMLMATQWPTYAEDLPPNLIKGGCAISGLFNLIPIQLCHVNDKVGMNRDMAHRNSPIQLPPVCHSPLIVTVGELESTEYHAQSDDFSTVWAGQGVPITELKIAGANHFSILESLVCKEGVLNKTILTQIK